MCLYLYNTSHKTCLANRVENRYQYCCDINYRPHEAHNVTAGLKSFRIKSFFAVLYRSGIGVVKCNASCIEILGGNHGEEGVWELCGEILEAW